MTTRYPALSRLIPALIFGVIAVLSATGATAQTREIRIGVSAGQLIELSRPAKNVFIADPNIADLQVPSPRAVFIYGKKTGTTSFYALDEDGRQIMNAAIVVTYNVGDLQRLLQQEAPNAAIGVESTPSGIVLSGVVPNAETADRVRVAASRYIGDKEALVNNMKVSGAQQVNLRVRVAEVDRQVTKELGFNWESLVSAGSFTFGLASGRTFLVPNATAASAADAFGTLIERAASPNNVSAVPGSLFGNLTTKRASVSGLIDALADQGLVTILAEPNLTTVSGQAASFLAGGEFPIPVSQGGPTAGAISIEFKQFGVSLDFVPTVLSNDHISIKVRPEVSQLSNQGAITTGGVTVPALTVRRAQTTIELGSGDSFAIAGLIQNNSIQDLNKFPALGDVPVIGALFRSQSFQRNESELVIIVTPYVVRPAGASAFRAPTDGFQPASDLEQIFLQHFNAVAPPGAANSAIGVTGERLRGDAGFITN
jgi:pilus assembly protein CpaC